MNLLQTEQYIWELVIKIILNTNKSVHVSDLASYSYTSFFKKK